MHSFWREVTHTDRLADKPTWVTWSHNSNYLGVDRAW